MLTSVRQGLRHRLDVSPVGAATGGWSRWTPDTRPPSALGKSSGRGKKKKQQGEDDDKCVSVRASQKEREGTRWEPLSASAHSQTKECLTLSPYLSLSLFQRGARAECDDHTCLRDKVVGAAGDGCVGGEFVCGRESTLALGRDAV